MNPVPSSPLKRDSPTLLLVEDEEVLRGLLREHIAINHSKVRIVETGDGTAAWSLFREERPEFCVVDLRLPGMDGWSLIELMAESHTPPRILILTAQMNWDPPGPIPGNGRLLYLDKTSPLAKLSLALSALISGNPAEDQRFRLSLAKTGTPADFGLTKRERLILSLIGGGLRIRAIAEMLGISPHTALTHRKNILRKLELNSSNQLVRFALENGISGCQLPGQ